MEYDHDVVLRRGTLSKRKKGPSRRFRDRYGHTPLSADEAIPWDGERLVVGTGAEGRLPVMDEVVREAERRGVELILLPTRQAIELLRTEPEPNAILHVTC